MPAAAAKISAAAMMPPASPIEPAMVRAGGNIRDAAIMVVMMALVGMFRFRGRRVDAIGIA
jgi:gamma-glutamyltranspeptidase